QGASFQNELAGIVFDRCIKRRQRAGDDLLFFLFDQGAYVFRYSGAEAFNTSHPFLQTTPNTIGFPGSIQYLTCDIGEVIAPMVSDRNQLSIRCKTAHVGMVSNCILAALFGSLHSGGGISVVSDDVGTLPQQCQCSITLLA